MFTPTNNHFELAVKRLITQYKGKDNLYNVLKSILGPIQDIETALNQLNTLRQLYTATGVNLDNLGKIIGLTRTGGESDSDYRIKLIAQIKVNTSQGEPESVIQVYQLLTNAKTILLTEGWYGSITMSSEHVFADQTAIDFMRAVLEAVLPAGVSVDTLITFDKDESFSYSGSLQGLGYGDVNDPLVGGKYATVI